MTLTAIKKAKSPYQRYGKTPYRYSEIYARWREATLRGDRDEAARLGRLHNSRFAMNSSFSDADHLAA